WLSFIDVPWKAITVGFAVADEFKKSDSEPRSTFQPKQNPKPPDPKEAEHARAGLVVTLVGIGSVLYPLVILAAVVMSAILIASGRNRSGFLIAGIACVGATVLYGASILLLNSIEEMRLVMVLVSPGFGWAVMFIGSFMLIIAGVIRTKPPAY